MTAKTPKEIAREHFEDDGSDLSASVLASIAAAIAADRADREPAVRHIIFTGPFEEAFSMEEATRRLEELLDEGHPTPTVVNAATDDGEVVGLTARKIIDTATAGEIR